jgi:hypothetical protein
MSMSNNNLIYTLCRKIRQSLCNDVLRGVHQILYILTIYPTDKDHATISLETDNKDIVKKINDILMNIIGTPLFAHEETENQYSLDISFDNLLQLYTFLQLKYR